MYIIFGYNSIYIGGMVYCLLLINRHRRRDTLVMEILYICHFEYTLW